mmetsp:Transcript_15086/g.40718  ORF Transcript_15086/g.40718 Transcript_15086/m.40718 type:complete len:216 (-) Transcript_15086:395-1042(-)
MLSQTWRVTAEISRKDSDSIESRVASPKVQLVLTSSSHNLFVSAAIFLALAKTGSSYGFSGGNTEDSAANLSSSFWTRSSRTFCVTVQISRRTLTSPIEWSPNVSQRSITPSKSLQTELAIADISFKALDSLSNWSPTAPLLLCVPLGLLLPPRVVAVVGLLPPTAWPGAAPLGLPLAAARPCVLADRRTARAWWPPPAATCMLGEELPRDIDFA